MDTSLCGNPGRALALAAGWCLLLTGGTPARGAAADGVEAGAVVESAAAARMAADSAVARPCRLQLQGLLSWVDRPSGRFVLEDDTGGVLIEGDAAEPGRLLGRRVLLTGTATAAGNRLVLGATQIRATGPRLDFAPRRIEPGQWLDPRLDEYRWSQVEGRVTFAAPTAQGLRLEIRAASGRLWAEVTAPSGDHAERFLGQRVRLRGVGEGSPGADARKVAARLFVAGLSDVEVLPPAVNDSPLGVLHEAQQVTQLSADDANQKRPVDVRGTVTFVFKNAGLCLQDASGAVWVHYAAAAIAGPGPRPGDLVRVQGATVAVSISPRIMASRMTVLGPGVFPEPVRPTWDALLSRNLAHAWVEIEGVFGPVRKASDRWQMTLSRTEGVVPVQLLHQELASTELARLRSYENGVVRVRGCVVPNTSLSNSDVRGSLIYVPDLSWVSLVEPSPADPLARPATPIADLFRYDPKATPVDRVKVAGVLLYAEADEGFLDDGTGGIRVLREGGLKAVPGDRLQTLGFVDLGEGYPVLRASVLRKSGQGELPAAIDADLPAILTGRHAGRRVRTEALLTGVQETAAGQSLALRVADRMFEARLPQEAGRFPPLQAGSRLRLTGVLRCEGVSPSLGGKVQSFLLLLGSPDDAVVLQHPPWWNARNAAIASSLLVAILAVALLWIALLRRQVQVHTRALAAEIETRQRADQQRAIAKERARIARDIHDDLGAGLTEIAMLADLGPESVASPGEIDRNYATIASRARAALASLSEIVWAVNPGNDTLQRLADYLCLMADSCFENTEVTCWRHVPVDLPATPVRAEVRHNLALAVKEAFANALRHSQATEVTLRADWAPPLLRVSVADNGVGFDAARPRAAGNGLRHQHERMEAVGGQALLQSTPGRGTVVTFTLRLDPPGATLE